MDRQAELWNRTGSPDEDLNTFGDLVFEKYGILNQWGYKMDYLIYCKTLRATFKNVSPRLHSSQQN